MAASQNTPQIFISYSWSPATNKERTMELANRLSNDGIHVHLDEWDLLGGQDKYTFMEQMVTNPAISKVLMICNKSYAEKANNRQGGVGIESLIISDDIYSKVENTKFIPIVFERGSDGSPYLPTFAKTRIYIDLSNEENYEDQYEKLLRDIFNKPASRRPPLGIMPSYLQEETPTFLGTAYKVSRIKESLLNDKKNTKHLIKDYYTSFLRALDEFEIKVDEVNDAQKIDEIVLDRIESMKPLRDDFVEFLEVVLDFPESFDNDKFIEFLENLAKYFHGSETFRYSSHYLGNLIFDHYRFFCYELFLYSTTLMIQIESFQLMSLLLQTNFSILHENNSEPFVISYLEFNNYVYSLEEHRNKRLQMQRKSIVADTIKQRANLKNYDFGKLQESEAILYYLSILPKSKSPITTHGIWYPRTAVYRFGNMQFFKKLFLTRYFEKAKLIFDVKDSLELKEKVDLAAQKENNGISRFELEIPWIQRAFDFTKIATL